MEKILKNIETKFEEQLTNFEKSPVKSTIKWAIIIFVVKKIWSWVKEEN